MALIKAANRGAGLKALVNYILRDDAIGDIDTDTEVNALRVDDKTPATIIDEMNATKEAFHKTGGRECEHHIISFSPAEVERYGITHADALAFAMDFVERTPQLYDRECVLAVHDGKVDDAGHQGMHVHIVNNSVSFEDGKKFHTSKAWLMEQMDTMKDMSIEYGYDVCEKGVDQWGDPIDRHEPESAAAYFEKHNAEFTDGWKVRIAVEVAQASDTATGREDFINKLADVGIEARWNDNRQHITYVDDMGNRVRDTRLEHDYEGVTACKDDLLERFEGRQDVEIDADAVEVEEDPADR